MTITEETTVSEPSTNGALLHVSDLRVTYEAPDAAPAVDGVGFEIAEGEVLALVGESGSGKSTTGHAIMGLLPFNSTTVSGSIRLHGTELVGMSDRRMRHIRGGTIGLVPQDPMRSLNPVKTVGWQLAESLKLHSRLPRSAMVTEAEETLVRAGFDDPDRILERYPHELSGGMRQRALIAMALAGRPRLIIADEPTSALDVTVQKQILDHLLTLVKGENIGLLLVTHDLPVALERADRVAVMSQGSIVEVGKVDSIRRPDSHPYTRNLFESAPSMRTERLVSETARPSGAQPILTARELAKQFPGQSERAVDGVSFEIFPGETLAIVGESGSGKTTTARLVAQLETADAGDVLLHCEPADLSSRRKSRRFRSKVQFVFQNPYSSLNPRMSIGDAIFEPLRIHGAAAARDRDRHVAELLDHVSLSAQLATRRPHELSGGQLQRVALARALALTPDVIICDEAVSALDATVQGQILELLAGLQREHGVSYLFISHDLAVVRLIAHRVLVMTKGRVVDAGPTEDVFRTPTHRYTRQLLESIPVHADVTRRGS